MATAKKRRKKKHSDGKLTEKAIKERVGERSFRLGQNYFESGAVFDCRRQGGLLKARCRGRSADSYAVSANVSGSRVDDADCRCPVGTDGHCKHVAALLLTWLHSPDEFRETEPLDERLADCNKAQLVDLIQQMIDREPDLESWLELALPTAASSSSAVKPDAYRRQAVAAFANAGYGWEADQEVTASLESLKKIGDQFHKQKNVESAAAVYSGILEGFVSEYETFHDETGNVTWVASQCIDALGKCLPQLNEGSETRHSAVRALFEVLRFDVNYGGIGLSDDVPEILLNHASPAERSAVVDWIREELPTDGDFTSDWRRKTWGGLLLDFEGEPEDDEAYLRHCREFGLTGDVVERLLERGRLEEALEEIRAASDYDLMGLADRLIAHRYTELAHTMVRERLASADGSRNNWQLRDWLKRFYKSRKNWQPLLELCVGDFRSRPSLSQYQEIRKLARKLKTWDSLRPELISGVPDNSNELIRIHLDEGEIEQAIALLDSRAGKRRGFAFGWDRVDLEVAQAAEKSHPETALRIYRAEIEGLIAARGRGSYQSACKFLKKVRQILKATGRSSEWDGYLSKLREENRSLRAFQDELKKARL